MAFCFKPTSPFMLTCHLDTALITYHLLQKVQNIRRAILFPLSKRLEFGAESIDAKFVVAAMVSSLKGNSDPFSGTEHCPLNISPCPTQKISVEDRSDWNGNGVAPRTKSRRT